MTEHSITGKAVIYQVSSGFRAWVNATNNPHFPHPTPRVMWTKASRDDMLLSVESSKARQATMLSL